MKLEDINITTFQGLDPGVQEVLIRLQWSANFTEAYIASIALVTIVLTIYVIFKYTD